MTQVVTNAVATASRQTLSSGSKALCWNRSQGLDAAVQQDEASTTASAPSASDPGNDNLGTNVTQEHGDVNSNASFPLDLGSRTPRFVTNTGAVTTTGQFSPARSGRTATHAPSAIPPGTNPSTPPRLNASGVGGTTEVRADLLDIQEAPSPSPMSITGTFVPLPSPRQNTQSPETHRLQQTLRNSASELAHTCSSLSDSGDGTSAFASLLANNASAVVETAQEG